MVKYKYQDKQKETVRVKKLAEHKAKQAEKEKQAALNGDSKKRKPINKASAWSEKQEAKERKLERQLKKQRKRDYLKRKANGEIPEGDDAKDGEGEDDNSDDEDGDEDESGSKDKNKDEGEDEDDWEELQNEERLAKKVKKGKMSSRDFDKQVGNMFADL